MRLLGVILGEGNGKVGEVFNFSLPSITSCPGASPWCLKHCYSNRYERCRPKVRKAYEHNLDLSRNSKSFVRLMTGVVPRILPCFRIHVSGDFHDETYVRSWLQICSAFPQTRFWAYTRSWSVPHLLPGLNRLRSLTNVSLFASVDPTMPLPPHGWRAAFVECDPRAEGPMCQEQTGLAETCLACGYCFRQSEGHVIFRVH